MYVHEADFENRSRNERADLDPFDHSQDCLFLANRVRIRVRVRVRQMLFSLGSTRLLPP